MAISRLLTVTIFLVAVALQYPHISRAAITAERIPFRAHASSNLGAASIMLSGVIYKPSGYSTATAAAYSAVVMLHGCGGMWSEQNITAVNLRSHFALPGAPNLQTNIEKWGIKLAQSGIVALAVDSYTKRRELPDYSHADVFAWQRQCAVPATDWSGKVNPYTERVFDLLAAYDYLASLREINSAKIASLGWSQGAQSTMLEAAVTTPSGETRDPPTRFIRNVSIYPGCGDDLKFGPSSDVVGSSYWRPYADMHLHVGQEDDFFDNCNTRATRANAFGGATAFVTFPPNYDDATHSYDNTRQTWTPPAPSIPAEAWPTSKCVTVVGNECAMKSTDIDALAFLQTVL